MAIDVVILAGAPAEPDMAPGGTTISRAMVQIGPKTMLQWIVDALKGSKSVGKIVAVGDVSADGLDEVIPPSTGFLENMLLGVNTCDAEGQVLVMSCDVPMITPEAIDDFIDRALASGADFCYPVITKSSCMAKYPDMKRTYFKTKEDTYTGGNIMLARTSFLKRNENQIAGAYAARKKPFALAGMIGFSFLLRAVGAQIICPCLLPVPMLENVLSKILGGKVAAIPTDYPEIGEDVDKLSDLEAVRAIMAPNN